MSIRTALLSAVFTFLIAGLGTLRPALAQSASASVEIAGFSYELFDLDPEDGITPAISFVEYLHSASTYNFGIDSQSIATFGRTSITGPFGFARTSFSATASSAEARFTAPPEGLTQFSAQNIYGLDFDITPSTGILFTSLATIAAHTEVASERDFMRAQSVARMEGIIHNTGDDNDEVSSFLDEVLVIQDRRTYGLSGYLHTGPEARHGWFSINTNADVTGAALVPEPSTWAMLLSGLGLLGWRRCQRSRPGGVMAEPSSAM